MKSKNKFSALLIFSLLALSLIALPGIAPFHYLFREAYAHALIADFNGDEDPDWVVGIPNEDVGNIRDAGAVQVFYGGPGPSNQVWTQDSPGIEETAEQFDRFGSSIAIGDFNHDFFTDLAIGVPNESVGGVVGAGAVNVIYGSSAGLSATAATGGGIGGRTDQLWTQNSNFIDGTSETGDQFGLALATGDLNGDGFYDLAIGVPREIVGTPPMDDGTAGGVNVIYGSSSGLAADTSAQAKRNDQFWTQDSDGIEDSSENTSNESDFFECFGDNFGQALATGHFNNDKYADLAIGVPGEENGMGCNEGAVNLIYGSSNGLSATSRPDGTGRSDQIFYQDIREAPIPSAHEQFGFSLIAGNFDGGGVFNDDLAIGEPGVSASDGEDGGSVVVLYSGSAGLSTTAGPGLQFWTQDSPSVDGTAKQADFFGVAVAAGDFNQDGYEDVAIGASGDAIFDTAGEVNVIYGSSIGLSPILAGDGSGRNDQLWTQNSPNVEGSSEVGDSFGQEVTAQQLGVDDVALIIGVPGEDIGTIEDAGAVSIIHGSSSGLSATFIPDESWSQNSPNTAGTSEAGDNFGRALAAPSTSN